MPPKKKQPQLETETVAELPSVESVVTAAMEEKHAARARAFEKVRQAVNASMNGGARVVTAASVEQVHHIRRPFGIPELDIRLAGGVPAGTVLELFGPDGTGKNFLIDCLIRNTQAIYKERSAIAYLSFGYGYDKNRGHQNGTAAPMTDAEIAQLRKYRGSMSAEEEERRRRSIGEFDIITLGDSKKGRESPAEEALQAAIDLYRSGLYQWIFVDEANMAPTGAEMAKTLKDHPTQANLATLMTRFLKKFVAAHGVKTDDGSINQTNVGLVMEARAKIGGFSPDPNAIETTGGYALKHIKAISVKLRTGAPIWLDKDAKDHKLGKEIHWEITKAKLGTHEGYKGSYRLMFSDGSPDTGGADVGGSLLALAVEAGIVTKSGAWYSLTETSERLGQGADTVGTKLTELPELYSRVYSAVLRAHNMNPIYCD